MSRDHSLTEFVNEVNLLLSTVAVAVVANCFLTVFVAVNSCCLLWLLLLLSRVVAAVVKRCCCCGYFSIAI